MQVLIRNKCAEFGKYVRPYESRIKHLSKLSIERGKKEAMWGFIPSSKDTQYIYNGLYESWSTTILQTSALLARMKDARYWMRAVAFHP